MEYFADVPHIEYEGPQSKNALSFKHYNPEEIIEGQSMRELLRFSVCYWHTFRGTGSDPFGAATLQRPWDDGTNSVENALKRVDVAFEFFEKLQAPYYCFHDKDVSPDGASLQEANDNFDRIADKLLESQERTGIKLLWGTANLFSHPRFMHGAATSPNADVFAYAAAQVKKAMEVTHRLGGENYVFWGGREGYMNLIQYRYETGTGSFSPLHASWRLSMPRRLASKDSFCSNPNRKSRPSISTISMLPPVSTSCGPMICWIMLNSTLRRTMRHWPVIQ